MVTKVNLSTTTIDQESAFIKQCPMTANQPIKQTIRWCAKFMYVIFVSSGLKIYRDLKIWFFSRFTDAWKAAEMIWNALKIFRYFTQFSCSVSAWKRFEIFHNIYENYEIMKTAVICYLWKFCLHFCSITDGNRSSFATKCSAFKMLQKKSWFRSLC